MSLAYRVTLGFNGQTIVRTIHVTESETDDVVMHVQQLPEYRTRVRLISIELIDD